MILDSILTRHLMILTITFRKQKNVFCSSKIKRGFAEHDLDQNIVLCLFKLRIMYRNPQNINQGYSNRNSTDYGTVKCKSEEMVVKMISNRQS